MTTVEIPLSDNHMNSCMPVVAIGQSDVEAEAATSESSGEQQHKAEDTIAEIASSGKALGTLPDGEECINIEEAPETRETRTDQDEVDANPKHLNPNARANLFFLESLLVLGAYMFAASQVLGLSAQAYILWIYGILYVVRLNVKARWFTDRELTYIDLTWVVLLWVPGVMLSIACLAIPIPLNDTVMTFSIILFVLGWTVGPRAEWQRKLWENNPRNKGKLYTLRLFSRSRNINYFCQVFLFMGWSLASANPINAWVPVLTTFVYIFYQIPKKEEILAERFPEEWKAYSRNTPNAFMPCLNDQTCAR